MAMILSPHDRRALKRAALVQEIEQQGIGVLAKPEISQSLR